MKTMGLVPQSVTGVRCVARATRAVVAGLSLVFSVLAVPTAAQSAADADTTEWSAKAELSLVAATGNSSAQTLGRRRWLEHQKNRQVQLLRVNFVRSTERGEVQAQSLSGLARASQRLTPRVELFGEFDYLRNRFAGFVDRYRRAASVFASSRRPVANVLRVFSGIGYLRESYVATDTTSAATVQTGLRYRWRIGDHGEIADELELSETLGRTEDWRASQTLNVTAGLSSFVSIKLSQRADRPARAGRGLSID